MKYELFLKYQHSFFGNFYLNFYQTSCLRKQDMRFIKRFNNFISPTFCNLFLSCYIQSLQIYFLNIQMTISNCQKIFGIINYEFKFQINFYLIDFTNFMYCESSKNKHSLTSHNFKLFNSIRVQLMKLSAKDYRGGGGGVRTW